MRRKFREARGGHRRPSSRRLVSGPGRAGVRPLRTFIGTPSRIFRGDSSTDHSGSFAARGTALAASAIHTRGCGGSSDRKPSSCPGHSSGNAQPSGSLRADVGLLCPSFTDGAVGRSSFGHSHSPDASGGRGRGLRSSRSRSPARSARGECPPEPGRGGNPLLCSLRPGADLHHQPVHPASSSAFRPGGGSRPVLSARLLHRKRQSLQSFLQLLLFRRMWALRGSRHRFQFLHALKFRFDDPHEEPLFSHKRIVANGLRSSLSTGPRGDICDLMQDQQGSSDSPISHSWRTGALR